MKLFPVIILCAISVSHAFAAPKLKLYTAKEFGFMAMFPSKVEVTSAKNAFGPIKAFASIDFSEKEERVVMYQIIAHRITKMKDSPAESDKETYQLIQTNLLLGICFWGRPLSEPLGRTGGRGKGG